MKICIGCRVKKRGKAKQPEDGSESVPSSKAGRRNHVWLKADGRIMQVLLSDNGDMVLTDVSGIVVVLDMSEHARARAGVDGASGR
jgi:hypothetical protein